MHKYHKISNLNSVLKQVNHIVNFRGLDNDEQPIYASEKLPIIQFTGTVKLHGTNAGIEYNDGEISFQSRSHKVNNGHYGFTKLPIDEVNRVIDQIKKDFKLPNNTHFIIFGEWAGHGIQKSVGVSQLPKRFYIFDIYLPNEEEFLDCSNLIIDEENIKDIENYWATEILIDFENIEQSRQEIQALVDIVEKECPVAKYHGVSGIGEGIVFKADYLGNRLIFKAKGEKHSIAKKDKIELDPEIVKNIDNFTNNFVTQERIKQAIFELKILDPSKQNTGDIVKWVCNDILTEELETLKELQLSDDQVRSKISQNTANLYFNMFML